MKSILIGSFALITAFLASPQVEAHTVNLSESFVLTEKPITIKFWVGGVCGACKSRIESALDVKGIRMASYDLENHECTVVYSAKKISEDQIHDLLSAAGHDTKRSKATDEQYNSLNPCCKYRTAEHNH